MQQKTALQNFWRAAENLAVDNTIEWHVSQASPLRRIHARQDLNLSGGGNAYSSGGFMANVTVDGTTKPGTQQQWFSRNSTFNRWNDYGNNNFVFLNTNLEADNTTGHSSFIKDTSIQDLYRPMLATIQNRTNNTPPELGIRTSANTVVKPTYIATPNDSADTLNQKLSNTNPVILLTPGIYQLDKTLNITQANTVILGTGLATFISKNNSTETLISISKSAKNTTIAGVILDAGIQNSDSDKPMSPLLSVGGESTALFDLYCRVGGAATKDGQAKDVTAGGCINITADHVIGDNLWLWRADHFGDYTSNPSSAIKAGTKWKQNTSPYGLQVSGSNVTMLGLAVEHFRKHQTQWTGNDGKTYFYQSELPYHIPPNHPSITGYTVDSTVTSHTAQGLGVYFIFKGQQPITLNQAYALPKPSQKILLSHLLGWIIVNNGSRVTSLTSAKGSPLVTGNHCWLDQYKPSASMTCQ